MPLREEILRISMMQSIETMAFLMPDEQIEPAAIDETEMNLARAQVEFRTLRSSPAGSCSIAVSRPLLGTIVRGMLGLADDAPLTPSEENDGLREMVNVISGRLAPALFPDREDVLAHPPRIVDNVASDVQAPGGADRSHVTLRMDGGIVKGLLEIEGAVR